MERMTPVFSEQFKEYDEFVYTEDPFMIDVHANAGFALLAMIPVQRAEVVNIRVPIKVDSYVNNETADAVEVVTNFSYLMGRKSNDRVSELSKKIAELGNKIMERDNQIDDLEKALKEEKEERHRLDKRVELKQSDVNILAQDNRNRADAMKKMEKDLGKIREAIGDLRMKEILDESETEGG